MTSRLMTLGVVVLLLNVAPAPAQSLGQVAAEEAARRKTIAAPARVLRDTDLRADYPVTTPTELPAWPEDAAADPTAPRLLVEPASFQGGPLPPIPVMAVAGGEVFLEVAVGSDGAVTGVKPFRDTPPFTDALSGAVRAWRFEPAEDAIVPPPGQPIEHGERVVVGGRGVEAHRRFERARRLRLDGDARAQQDQRADRGQGRQSHDVTSAGPQPGDWACPAAR